MRAVKSVLRSTVALGLLGAAPVVAQEPAQPRATTEAPEARDERVAERLDDSQMLPARIDFRSEVDKQFELIEIKVFLDGRQMLHRIAPDGEVLPQQLSVYEGPVQSGGHQLVAYLVFRGRNRGPFTYMDSYKVKVESRQGFVARPDRAPSFTLVADDRAAPNSPVLREPVVTMEGDVEPAVPVNGNRGVPASTPVPR